MKKPNAGVSKMVKAVTGNTRVKRTNQPGAVVTKHGVKPNIPTMGDDRTGAMTGAPAPKWSRGIKK